jgi:hypothetical protein
MTLGAHPDLRLARDSTGTKLGLGSSFELRPGLYAERFTIALDVSASFVFTTYMHHSQAVRSLFYERYPGETPGVSGPRTGFTPSHRSGSAWGLPAEQRSRARWPGMVSSALPTRVSCAASSRTSHGPLPFYVAAGGQYRW